MKSLPRIAHLDRLRAVAALMVICVHLHQHPTPGGFFSGVELVVRRMGLVGVDMFFVLSGFLIGTLLLTELNDRSRINISRFIIRRGFKLYPVYYVFMAYSVTREIMKACQTGTVFHSALGDTLHEFLSSFFFLQNYIPPDPAAHTWSLAVEEHFYLALPLLLALLGRKRFWPWLIPLGLATVPLCLLLRILSVWRQGAGANIGSGLEFNLGYTHLHVDALMTGVVLAAIALKRPDVFLKLGGHPKSLMVFGVILWLAAALPVHWPYYWATVGFTLRIAGSAAILLGVCHQSASGDAKGGLLAWIGRNWYAIYVWHITVLGITENIVARYLNSHVHNDSIRWLILTPVIMTACVLVGALMTRLVEKPSLFLRDKWFPSLGRTISIPSQTANTDAAKPVDPKTAISTPKPLNLLNQK